MPRAFPRVFARARCRDDVIFVTYKYIHIMYRLIQAFLSMISFSTAIYYHIHVAYSIRGLMYIGERIILRDSILSLSLYDTDS